MAAEDMAAVFDLSGGADRRQSPLTRPANRLLDVMNLLPRSPIGATVIRMHAVAVAGTAAGTTDILPGNRPDGSLALVSRGSAAYRDLMGGPLPAIAFADCALNDLAAYRGQVAIAQQGQRVQLLDLSASTCTSLDQSPRAGVVEEYKTMLWAAGDVSEDDSAPAVTIPLAGVVIPPPQAQVLKSGTADVTFNNTAGTSAVKDTSGTAGAFTGCAGKIILLGGSGYAILSVSTTTVADDTATVKAISGKPGSATGEPYQVLASAPLVAYPAALDMGSVFLFNDSGKADCRLFNTGSSSIRVTAVRPKGNEVRVEDLPSLPATIPPGGSLSFGVIFTPESDNVCSASIVVEHDFYAQDSIVVPVTCRGTTREVLASPSVVHFGAWIAGAPSPPIAIEIKNPLADAVTLKLSGWATAFGGNFALDASTPLPSADVTIEAGKSYTLKVAFTPPSGATGALTGSLTFKRTIPAKPYRVWRSRPGDAKTWIRDREWVDLSADGLAGGAVRAIRAYDDALVCFKDASVWAIVPGGLNGGYRPVQLALGEGVGAFGPQAVCTGGGALWWGSKAGIFRSISQDVKRISGPIEDLIWGLTPAQYASVRLVWYDNMLWVCLPATPQLGAMLWVFRPDYPDSEGSWWRVNYAPTALACDKGATRKEALYGVVGADLLHLDATEGVAGVPWSLTTPIITGADPDSLKRLVGLTLDVSEEALITTAKATFNNGGQAYAVLLPFQSGVSLGGVARYDGAGHLAVDPTGYPDHALDGLPCVVAGLPATIASNVGTTITLTAPVAGLPAMAVTYAVGDSSPTPLVKMRGLYGEGAVGSQFSVLASGATVASGKGQVAGFSLDFEPVCAEALAE
jgi:hypothetical protein